MKPMELKTKLGLIAVLGLGSAIAIPQISSRINEREPTEVVSRCDVQTYTNKFGKMYSLWNCPDTDHVDAVYKRSSLPGELPTITGIVYHPEASVESIDSRFPQNETITMNGEDSEYFNKMYSLLVQGTERKKNNMF